MWATTAQLYPSQDAFEFDQGHVTKNQPIIKKIIIINIFISIAPYPKCSMALYNTVLKR